MTSIDPDDLQFADLEPLRQILAGVDVVVLGEASHGDGRGILARTRLVKFLHERLAFDVLVFESGMYGCWDADRRIRAGADPLESLRRCAWGVWSNAAEIRPLAGYVGEQARTPRPLTLAGFDNQFVFEAPHNPPEPFVAMIREIADRVAVAAGRAPAPLVFDSLLAAVLAQAFWRDTALARPDTATFAEFVHWLAILRDEHGRVDQQADWARHDLSPAMWQRLLAGVLVAAHDQPWHRRDDADDWSAFNRRDEQMARNLLWLLEESYNGKKLIVWAHNFHLMRNVQELVLPRMPQLEYYRHHGVVPMGEPLWDALGTRIYHLATTAYEGRAAQPSAGGRPAWDIAQDLHPSTELEELLAETGLEYAIVDLRGLPATHGLRQTLVARPLNYMPVQAHDWGRHVDGFLFVRTMAPSTRAPR